MSFSPRLMRLSILTLLVGGMIGCNSFTNFGFASVDQGNFPLTQISQIAQNPRENTVYLKGKVTNQVPFVGSGAYQLEDETGLVWVITNKTLPPIGKEIAIEGQITYQSIPIGQEDMGEVYILEIKQIEPQRLAQRPTSETPVVQQPVVTQAPTNVTSEPIEPPIAPPATRKPKPSVDLPFLPHKQNQK